MSRAELCVLERDDTVITRTEYDVSQYLKGERVSAGNYWAMAAAELGTAGLVAGAGALCTSSSPPSYCRGDGRSDPKTSSVVFFALSAPLVVGGLVTLGQLAYQGLASGEREEELTQVVRSRIADVCNVQPAGVVVGQAAFGGDVAEFRADPGGEIQTAFTELVTERVRTAAPLKVRLETAEGDVAEAAVASADRLALLEWLEKRDQRRAREREHQREEAERREAARLAAERAARQADAERQAKAVISDMERETREVCEQIGAPVDGVEMFVGVDGDGSDRAPGTAVEVLCQARGRGVVATEVGEPRTVEGVLIPARVEVSFVNMKRLGTREQWARQVLSAAANAGRHGDFDGAQALLEQAGELGVPEGEVEEGRQAVEHARAAVVERERQIRERTASRVAASIGVAIKRERFDSAEEELRRAREAGVADDPRVAEQASALEPARRKATARRRLGRLRKLPPRVRELVEAAATAYRRFVTARADLWRARSDDPRRLAAEALRLRARPLLTQVCGDQDLLEGFEVRLREFWASIALGLDSIADAMDAISAATSREQQVLAADTYDSAMSIFRESFGRPEFWLDQRCHFASAAEHLRKCRDPNIGHPDTASIDWNEVGVCE
ncbi:MAG: hypothetical protein HYV07_03930 [Deltaproteobacteria bacterium]|nr:hypothetical protein [Deltaproteobacteria bacterium]